MDIGLSTFNSLKGILSDIVVKFGVEAKLNETENSKINYGYYKIAKQETDTFGTYTKFPIDVIGLSGITTNTTLMQMYADNPNTIPRECHDLVLTTNRKYVIDNFVEENNYYRSLIGLPNIDDYDFIYVDEKVALENEISYMTPIHELSDHDVIVLDSIGYIDELIKKNPTKRYLKFLGNNKVDLILARESLNFALLRLPKGVDSVIYESFVVTYNKARDYFGRMIFNEQFAKRYDMYEGFIGLCLLIASVQQLSAFAYKNNVYREFFDTATIKAFFDCYNMPFFKDIPLDRQRILVKNINKLLHVKSTNQVIYDVCSILGFESIEIYQYYLIKEHRLDENGIPRKDKTLTSDGVEVPNYDLMYDLYFHPINLKDKNPTLSFLESDKRIPYEEVVSLDPYWFDDNDVRKEIYETNFNYTETKYLSISTMYRLTKMMFEITHFYRIIQDNKKYTNIVKMNLPKLFGSEQFSFFDTAVFSLALISKRMGFNGEIVDTPTKVMSIYGFNFKNDYPTILNMINNDKYLLARKKEILKFINLNPLFSPTDINVLYANVRDLHMYLKEQIANTKDLYEYRSLKKFYKAVLVMDDTNEMFRLKDGTLASTMGEYLNHSAPLMGKFLETVDNDVDLNAAITHVIIRFETIISELKYLNILSEQGSTLFKALMQLLQFFKSYTVDITSVAMTYMLDDRDEQMVKILDNMKSIISTNIVYDNSLITLYNDFISMKANILGNDKVELNAVFDYNSTLTVEESVRFKFAVSMFNMFMELRTPMLKSLFEDSLFIESLHEVEAKISSIQKCIEYSIKNSYTSEFEISSLMSMTTENDVSFKQILLDFISILSSDNLDTDISSKKDDYVKMIITAINDSVDIKFTDDLLFIINHKIGFDIKTKEELLVILTKELTGSIGLKENATVKYHNDYRYNEFVKFIYSIGYLMSIGVETTMITSSTVEVIMNTVLNITKYTKDKLKLVESSISGSDKTHFDDAIFRETVIDFNNIIMNSLKDNVSFVKDSDIGDMVKLIVPVIETISASIERDDTHSLNHLVNNFIKETYTTDYLKYKQMLLNDVSLSGSTKRSFTDKTWRDFLFFIKNNVNVPAYVEDIITYDELNDTNESYELLLLDSVFKVNDNALSLHDTIVKS